MQGNSTHTTPEASKNRIKKAGGNGYKEGTAPPVLSDKDQEALYDEIEAYLAGPTDCLNDPGWEELDDEE